MPSSQSRRPHSSQQAQRSSRSGHGRALQQGGLLGLSESPYGGNGPATTRHLSSTSRRATQEQQQQQQRRRQGGKLNVRAQTASRKKRELKKADAHQLALTTAERNKLGLPPVDGAPDTGELWDLHALRMKYFDDMKATMERTRDEAYMTAAAMLSRLNHNPDGEDIDVVERTRRAGVAQKLRELCDNMELKIAQVDSVRANIKRKQLRARKLAKHRVKEAKITQKDLDILQTYEQNLYDSYNDRIETEGIDTLSTDQNQHRVMIQQFENFKVKNKLDQRRSQYDEFIAKKEKARARKLKQASQAKADELAATLKPVKGSKRASGKKYFNPALNKKNPANSTSANMALERIKAHEQALRKEQNRAQRIKDESARRKAHSLTVGAKLQEKRMSKMERERAHHKKKKRKEQLQAAEDRRRKETDQLDKEDERLARANMFEAQRKAELAQQRKAHQEQALRDAAEQRLQDIRAMELREKEMQKQMQKDFEIEKRARKQAVRAAKQAKLDRQMDERKNRKEASREQTRQAKAKTMSFGKDKDALYKPRNRQYG